MSYGDKTFMIIEENNTNKQGGRKLKTIDDCLQNGNTTFFHSTQILVCTYDPSSVLGLNGLSTKEFIIKIRISFPVIIFDFLCVAGGKPSRKAGTTFAMHAVMC